MLGFTREAFLGKVFGMNQHGVFSPMKFHSQLVKYGDTTLKEILPGPLFKEVKELGEVALAANAAEQLAGNPSGTARNLISFQEGRAFLTKPIEGIQLSLPYTLMAKAYLNPGTRKWLTSALQTSVDDKAAMMIYGKLAGVLSKPFISRHTERDNSTPVYADPFDRPSAGDDPKEISKEHYRAGLEAFLNGDKKTTRKNWELAAKIDPQNLEAQRGLERLDMREGKTKKYAVSPKAAEASKDSYRSGLEAFLKDDQGTALSKWKSAYAQDRNNLEAKRGVERIEQKRKSQTALVGDTNE